jgi:hypothetical protein
MMKTNKKGASLKIGPSATSDQNPVAVDPKKIDRDLDDFERGIMLLKREYEIYLSGASKLPPTDSRNKLHAASKRLQSLQGTSYAQRFRYNSLASRLTTYQDLWNKQFRLKEEGKSAPAPVIKTKMEHARSRQQERPPNGPDQPYEKIFKDYLSSRETTGEQSPKMNYDGFSALLKKQRETLISKFQCKDVQFYVSVENGRTKLKARTVK